MTPSGMEPATFRFEAQCFKVWYRGLKLKFYTIKRLVLYIYIYICTHKISLELHFSVEARFLHLRAFTGWNIICNFQYVVSKMISKSVSHFVQFIFHSYFIQKIPPPPPPPPPPLYAPPAPPPPLSFSLLQKKNNKKKWGGGEQDPFFAVIL